MSIHFILGKPGGGKSRWATEKIVNELLESERVIFTNLPLNLGELNDYLQRTSKKDINLFERLVSLDDEQASEFWTYRPPGEKMAEPGDYHRIPRLEPEQWKAKKRPDYTGVCDKGVFYLIDEVHNYFNARSWMETGRDVLFYNSQHRHLGDTVYFITQDLELVDKQFRFLAQDYCECMNMSKVKVSFWKMPAMFIWKLRVSPAENSPVVETGTFLLDKEGIAKCYYTTRLVKGGKADMNEKRRGIPWWVGVAALGVLLLTIFFVIPRFIFGFVGSHISSKTPETKASHEKTNSQTIQLTEPASADRMVDGGLHAPVSTNEIRAVGYSALIRPEVWLSDGSTKFGPFRANADGITQGTNFWKWASASSGTNEIPKAPITFGQIAQPLMRAEYVIKDKNGVVVGRRVTDWNTTVDDGTGPGAKDLGGSPEPLRSDDGTLRHDKSPGIPE